MFNSWWKRLFNDDEDHEIDHPSEPSASGSPYQSPVGRIEDPERKVQVRMVNQYPKTTPAKTTYEPSFAKARRSREHFAAKKEPIKKSAASKEEPADSFAAEAQALKSKMKTPFTRTEVPSPIYGFRKRPNTNYVPFQFEASNKGISKEQPVKEKPTMKSPALQQRENRATKDIKSREEVTPERSTVFKSREEAVPEAPAVVTPREEVTPERPNVFRSREEAEQEAPAMVRRHEEVAPGRATFDRSREEAVPGAPAVVTLLEEVEPEAPPVDRSGEEAAPVEPPATKEEQPSGIKNTMPVEDKNADQSKNPPVHTEQRRSSRVPFNVLMYRSDKQALSEKKASVAEPAATAKEPVNSPETSVKEHLLSVDLLNAPDEDNCEDTAWLDEKQQILQQTLTNFQVKAEMVGFVEGPSVTRFDIRLHPGVKVNKVINLTEDIKLSLAAKQIRIAPVPGKNTVGIEVPNEHRKSVYLKHLLESEAFKTQTSPLTAVLGLDVTGENVVTDLSKMPHGLIAGATGSGKSVCIHSLILSLIYKSNPDDLRLILIDPKVVELAAYQKLPHLAAPVLTQPKEASLALKWAVEEMERRYHVFAAEGVRDITRYNAQIGEHGEKMPFIVIIIDELADLMMVSPQDVEEAICRIAQKARAAGIHLILATQRPSVDVITGLIKSNIPTRIAFSVSSQADSRTILDSGGAERLLGQGDMLFSENGARVIKRLQGCFVSDEEIDRITNALANTEAPPYLFEKDELSADRQDNLEEEDELFGDAGFFVLDQGQASVSSLQRRFRIGYNRAARLVDQLERLGVISEANGSKPRSILMSAETFKENVINQEIY